MTQGKKLTQRRKLILLNIKLSCVIDELSSYNEPTANLAKGMLYFLYRSESTIEDYQKALKDIEAALAVWK